MFSKKSTYDRHKKLNKYAAEARTLFKMIRTGDLDTKTVLITYILSQIFGIIKNWNDISFDF